MGEFDIYHEAQKMAIDNDRYKKDQVKCKKIAVIVLSLFFVLSALTLMFSAAQIAKPMFVVAKEKFNSKYEYVNPHRIAGLKGNVTKAKNHYRFVIVGSIIIMLGSGVAIACVRRHKVKTYF